MADFEKKVIEKEQKSLEQEYLKNGRYWRRNCRKWKIQLRSISSWKQIINIRRSKKR